MMASCGSRSPGTNVSGLLLSTAAASDEEGALTGSDCYETAGFTSCKRIAPVCVKALFGQTLLLVLVVYEAAVRA